MRKWKWKVATNSATLVKILYSLYFIILLKIFFLLLRSWDLNVCFLNYRHCSFEFVKITFWNLVYPHIHLQTLRNYNRKIISSLAVALHTHTQPFLSLDCNFKIQFQWEHNSQHVFWLACLPTLGRTEIQKNVLIILNFLTPKAV